MFLISSVALCLSLFVVANANYASIIDPCKWDDSDCILKSSQKALENLKPLIEKEMTVKDVNGDKGELKLKATDLVVHDLSNCKFVEAKRPDPLKLHMMLDCPIDATGNYKINGTLLFAKVYGQGPFHITTKQLRIGININMAKEKGKDGFDHYKFGKYTFEYNPIQKVHFKLENLFGGDKTQADPVNQLIDENWKELIVEFGGPIIDAVVHRAVKVIAKICYELKAEEFEKP